MFIDSIILHNYRAYRGTNTVRFKSGSKNVSVIAGNNGYGKTTFLTSIIWCLYGKLMADVDDKFRHDINDVQGYKNYAKINVNNAIAKELESVILSPEQKKYIQKNGYVGPFEYLADISSCFIQINITDIFIPSIPCTSISIRRTFDYLLESENVEVLIDGQINELAKEVGYDIFINDFILSKDIAKFFLFDAEKIVSLSEVKTIDEKRRLSKAYSEVLGIKKYEDIRRNLENIRIKYRRNSNGEAAVVNRNKLDKLTKAVEEFEKHILNTESRIQNIDESILNLKKERESLQERLIREGNAMSIDELDRQKALMATLRERDNELKLKLREMLDIAPFAISGYNLLNLKKQVEAEIHQKTSKANGEAINTALQSVYQQLHDKIGRLLGPCERFADISKIMDESFHSYLSENTKDDVNIKPLLDWSTQEDNGFNALFDKIKYSFSVEFKQLVKDIKAGTRLIVKTQKIINAAESDNGNTEITTIRLRKDDIERQINLYEQEARDLSEQLGNIGRDYNVSKKQLSEILKTIRVNDSDKEKDAIAQRLIDELSNFLFELKNMRKSSLERKIMSEIHILMHKSDFICSVDVQIKDDIIDINLLDKNSQIIDKEKLSKGEQQLYATAILKALVDESGISFPVFIDSPLQKFDSIHAHNIITKFYPNVAKQVVIFPLLGKELSEEEYNSLLPVISRAYIINNINGESSIVSVNPNNLFSA